MTRFTPLVLALAVGTAVTACGSSQPTKATLPSQVRQDLINAYAGMAFVPGRLPDGYHYVKWAPGPGALSEHPGSAYALSFRHGSGENYVNLEVGRRSCPAPPKWPAKDTHTIHVNGHTLKWLESDYGPFVWRCMTNAGRSFVISGVSQSESQEKLAELVGYAVPAD